MARLAEGVTSSFFILEVGYSRKNRQQDVSGRKAAVKNTSLNQSPSTTGRRSSRYKNLLTRKRKAGENFWEKFFCAFRNRDGCESASRFSTFTGMTKARNDQEEVYTYFNRAFCHLSTDPAGEVFIIVICRPCFNWRSRHACWNLLGAGSEKGSRAWFNLKGERLDVTLLITETNSTR